MQICSVSLQKFNVFNWSTISFVVSIAIPIFYPAAREHLAFYLYACLIIQALFLFELVLSFLRQAASILNIKLFTINHFPETLKAQ
jgi:hypothetical protein